MRVDIKIIDGRIIKDLVVDLENRDELNKYLNVLKYENKKAWIICKIQEEQEEEFVS